MSANGGCVGRNNLFSERLTEIIYKIRSKNSHMTLGGIQDNLGRALGRTGRSAIEHWRKGYAPKRETLEALTQLLAKQGDLSRDEVQIFLQSAAHPYVDEFCDRFFSAPLPVPSPLQLPRQPYNQLYGREETVAEIVEKLHPLSNQHCIVVDGVPGVGKTSLSYRVAEQCAQRKLFQKIVWLDMGENSTIHPRIIKQPGPLWRTILDAIWYQLLDVEIEGLLAAEFVDKQWDIQQFLYKTPTLLIMDDLGLSPEPQNKLIQQLRPLLGQQSKMLCLSTCRLAGDIYSVHLGGLSQEAARNFIRAEGQIRQIRSIDQLQDSDLEKLVKVTGGSPLAMKLVASQLDHLPLDRVLHHLKTAEPLTAIREQDVYVQLYQSIYLALWKNLSLNGQRLLVTLSLLVPGSGEIEETIKQLCEEADEQKLYQGITELWNVSLIERTHQEDTIVYHLHALTQQFVIAEVVCWYERDKRGESNEFLHSFKEDLVQGLKYLLTVQMSVKNRDFALHLLTYSIEIPALWPETSQLLLAIAPQMYQSHADGVWMGLLERAIEQATLSQEIEIEAELRFYLGRRLYQSDMDLSHAELTFRKSLQCFGDANNAYGQARALNELASVARLQRQFDPARQWAEEALSLLGDTDSERIASYLVLGNIVLDQRDSAQAETWFTQALHLAEAQAEIAMTATILTSMGIALRRQSEYDQAIVHYQRAIALFQEMEKPVQQAITMMNLGNIFILSGYPGKALKQYEMAEPILQHAHMEFYLTKLYTNQGIAHCRLGHWSAAQSLIELSIQRWEKMDNFFSLANTMDELGLIYSGQQKWTTAIAKFRRALEYLHRASADPARDGLEREIRKHLQVAEDVQSEA